MKPAATLPSFLTLFIFAAFLQTTTAPKTDFLQLLQNMMHCKYGLTPSAETKAKIAAQKPPAKKDAIPINLVGDSDDDINRIVSDYITVMLSGKLPTRDALMKNAKTQTLMKNFKVTVTTQQQTAPYFDSENFDEFHNPSKKILWRRVDLVKKLETDKNYTFSKYYSEIPEYTEKQVETQHCNIPPLKDALQKTADIEAKISTIPWNECFDPETGAVRKSYDGEIKTDGTPRKLPLINIDTHTGTIPHGGWKGRGNMWFSGISRTVDAGLTKEQMEEVVVGPNGKKEKIKVLKVQMILRGDGRGWAFPGGYLDKKSKEGNTPAESEGDVQGAIREYIEESIGKKRFVKEVLRKKNMTVLGNMEKLFSENTTLIYYGKVRGDDKAGENVWLETFFVNFHQELGQDNMAGMKFKADDDALAITWVRISKERGLELEYNTKDHRKGTVALTLCQLRPGHRRAIVKEGGKIKEPFAHNNIFPAHVDMIVSLAENHDIDLRKPGGKTAIPKCADYDSNPKAKDNPYKASADSL